MNKKAWIAATVVVIVAAGIWFWSSNAQQEAKPKAEASQSAASQNVQGKQPAQGAREISTATTYKSPGGEDKIGFTVVLDGSGMITDLKTEMMPSNPGSKQWQDAFTKAAPAALKGKKLSDLQNIDKVGGASLTTAAFNQALEQLKSQI